MCVYMYIYGVYMLVFVRYILTNPKWGIYRSHIKFIVGYMGSLDELS